MISESFYWKKELYDCYTKLAKFINGKKWFETSFVNAEKAIMLSAYIIRKLNDAEKIPPDFLSKKINLTKYSSNNKLIDHYTCHRIDSNYQLEHKESETKDILYFLDQIIHSFTFMFGFSDANKPEGFYFNSDKTKNEKLYYFEFKIYLEIILKISEGSIISAENHRDKKTHEMKLIKATYGYTPNFNLTKIINETMKGKIYKRDKMYFS